jgi:hypothetical protein
VVMVALTSCRTPPLASDTLYDRPPAGGAGGAGGHADADAAEVVDADAPGSDTAKDLGGEDEIDGAGDGDDGAAPDPVCPEEPPVDSNAWNITCEPNRREAGFSGGVVDACEPNRTLNANVSIGGQRRCSGAGKGAFDFQLLQWGCKLTLVAAKPGYLRYCRVITAPRAGYTIMLQREGGCSAPPPGATACTCQEPGCTPHTGE